MGGVLIWIFLHPYYLGFNCKTIFKGSTQDFLYKYINLHGLLNSRREQAYCKHFYRQKRQFFPKKVIFLRTCQENSEQLFLQLLDFEVNYFNCRVNCLYLL